jgi:DNA mismatch repair protein MutS2
MHSGVLRTLEFDRIREVLAREAFTPLGRARALALEPAVEPDEVRRRLDLTQEAASLLKGAGRIGLDAPEDLEAILASLTEDDQEPLAPPALLGLARFTGSVATTATAVRAHGGPGLRALVAAVPDFSDEIAAIARAILPSGEVSDDASPALREIRDGLRRQRAKLRATLEQLVRGRDTAKYLQDQIITDRQGRYVVVVRSEHKDGLPGIVHGSSASGASLYVEPLSTVDLNNDVVALAEREKYEVYRILLALTSAFRMRGDEFVSLVDAAARLDEVLAKARLAVRVDGTTPALVSDGRIEFKGARHPLLIPAVRDLIDNSGSSRAVVVSSDLILVPPTRALVISGPNTGGKTVALKAFGLLALMAQAGLLIPVDDGSAFTPFRSVFADIGDEQSIAASLSTFSAHITNLVSMDQNLELPALVLLDEVGAGTDPAEGGALGTAVIDHFRKRGAHVMATTHYDALKTYAATTEGVESAAFGFDPVTFAPTYQITYGSPGRSLAIEIAARLGMPPSVIGAARGNLSNREAQLSAHIERVDHELAALQHERKGIGQQRLDLAEGERRLRQREASIREKEDALKRRLSAKMDDQLRDARREIDAVIENLKARATVLREKGEKRVAGALSTGETGMARSEAHAALDAVGSRVKSGTIVPEPPAAPAPSDGPLPGLAPGVRVAGPLGVEGIVLEISGKHAEIDVRGKRMRARVADLRVIGKAPAARASVSIDLQPREGSLSELNVVGCTVDEALTRAARFLDETMLTDRREVRIIHGHGTGQLRRALTAFFKEHPLVAGVELARTEHGGGGVTVVSLKE